MGRAGIVGTIQIIWVIQTNLYYVKCSDQNSISCYFHYNIILYYWPTNYRLLAYKLNKTLKAWLEIWPPHKPISNL